MAAAKAALLLVFVGPNNALKEHLTVSEALKNLLHIHGLAAAGAAPRIGAA